MKTICRKKEDFIYFSFKMFNNVNILVVATSLPETSLVPFFLLYVSSAIIKYVSITFIFIILEV